MNSAHGVSTVVVFFLALGMYWAGVSLGRLRNDVSRSAHAIVAVFLVILGFVMHSGVFRLEPQWVVSVLAWICWFMGVVQFVFIWSPPSEETNIDYRTMRERVK